VGSACLEQGSQPPVEPGQALPERLSALLRELVRLPQPGPDSGWLAALGPGAVVDRFRLIRKIGRGSFGVVFEAQDLELGRLIALKVLRPGQAHVPADERALAEAEAAARLSHPNIVTLFDAGRCEHGPYLVFELLHGATLAERLKQGPPEVAEAIRIVTEVARGLSHAHAHGVVHRDLSPRNVFLCQDGQVKVLDFGMACAFGHRALGGGTPGYMAPEQRRGAPEDERTDVFALGVLLYRLLAGQAPFPAEGELTHPAPALEVSEAPGVGPLLARMLAIDPVGRPRDASQVLGALAADARSSEPAAAGTPRVVVKRFRARAVAVGSAGAVLATVAAGAWLAWRGRVSIAPERSPSVAVLPFETLGPPTDQEPFSEGLTEEILSALSRVDGLRVPSRTSSNYYKGRRVRLPEIGRELKVANVLEGTARREGGRVRVVVRLVRIADDSTIWSRRFDRELSDIFDVQDEIAEAVVGALTVSVGKGGVKAPHAYRSPSTEAYLLYLEGEHEFDRLTIDGLQRAEERYRRALELDPAFAPAWAGLGLALRAFPGEAVDPAAARARARAALDAAERAVALGPRLPEAFSVRAMLRGEVERDWGRAREDAERALALGPGAAGPHRVRALVHLAFGRIDEALAEARRAAELDPLGESVYILGLYLQLAGDLEESEAAYRRHLATMPGSLLTRVGLARTLLLRSRPREAAELYAGVAEAYYRLQGLAMAEHALGHVAAADANIQELTARFGRTDPFLVAEAHAWRGEREEALAWIGKAIDAGDFDEADRWSPFLRILRDDPGFKAAVRRLKLPVDAAP
jgi:TolB-like protein/tetratricopeptide (TPR) repeat protein